MSSDPARAGRGGGERARRTKWHVHRPVSDVYSSYRSDPAAFRAGRERQGFRLCHYVVTGNHAHLVCEGADRVALARGLQGLAIRVARAVNRACARQGRLFADRYPARILRTPREVHDALVYVLLNWRKHAHERRAWLPPDLVDACSSAPFFDGWRDFPGRERGAHGRDGPAPVAPAHTWLLTVGWRRRGLLSVNAVPQAPVEVRPDGVVAR